MVYAYNPRVEELRQEDNKATEGQPGLHGETLPQENKQRRKV